MNKNRLSGLCACIGVRLLEHATMKKLKTLKQLRDDRGLSQPMVSDACGLSAKQVSNLEQGHNYPTANSIHKLAAAYDLPVADIVLAARATQDEKTKLDNQDKTGESENGKPAGPGLVPA